jgi:hypothetical protein
MRAAALSVLFLVGISGVAAADALLVGRVTDLVGKPVAGARVHVLSGSDRQTVTTDKDGNYRVIVDGDREVSVVIGAGTQHTFRRGAIRNGAIQQLDIEVEIAEGEVIRIIDQKPPTVPPKLPKNTPRVTPPYSEEAVTRDAWARAWLLLDIDEAGKVRRVKLVKRPGFSLDEIAVKEAMKLHFEPALDEKGKPMRTQIFWSMEWPSHGWLVEHNGTATKLPTESYAIDPFKSGFGRLQGLAVPTAGASALHGVRCAGTGPLNLDLRYPVYRDCSKPNLKKVPLLPWLDGTGPIPPDPPAIARKPEPPIVRSNISYIPEIVGSTITATLLIGTVYAYVQASKYGDRINKSTGPEQIYVDLQKYYSDSTNFARWHERKIIGTLATIGVGCITSFMWMRHKPKSTFSVQPEDDGGSFSYTRDF